MMLLLIIIPAEILDAVRAAAETGFGDVAKAAFVATGLPTGEAPSTNWWLAGIFAAEEMEKIPALHSMFPAAHVDSYDLGTQAGRPWDLLGEMGLKSTKSSLP